MKHANKDGAGGPTLAHLIEKVLASGADAADAVLINSMSLSVARRMGQSEKLERTESTDLGLRVFSGKRQALVSTTDTTEAALEALAERALAMMKVVPEDEYCGLAGPEQIARDFPDLDLLDDAAPLPETLIDLANRTEAAALAVKGITNSEGAEAGWSRSEIAFAASNGFSAGYATSGTSLSVSVLAGEGTGMERDYDFTSAVHAEDMRSPEDVGYHAGLRTVRRLNPKKGKTKKVPVVFDPRLSGGLLGSLSGAISGSAIARKTSFLKDRLGERIFSAGVTVVDDPFIRRGLRSRPFDGEGLLPVRRNIVTDGVLETWLLDLRSARQLGLAPTGHAGRSVGSPPQPRPSNLYMQPGLRAPQELISEIEDGFYVTELLGSGANLVTGDYSRGASGFWITRGELTFPVSEMTIAGNLRDMFLNIEPANDLVLRYGIDAPTVRIDGMTVAGS